MSQHYLSSLKCLQILFSNTLVPAGSYQRFSQHGARSPAFKVESRSYAGDSFMLEISRHCYQFLRTPCCSFFHWNGWRTYATQYCSLSLCILHSLGAQLEVCWLQSQHFNVILIYSHRIALFFTATSVSWRTLWVVCWGRLNTSQLAGAFSGLLAAAISRMDGIAGRRGWQWIFILVSLFALCIIANTFFLAYRRVCWHLSLGFLVFFLVRRLLKKQTFWPRRRKSKSVLIDRVSSWHQHIM